jgi:hypothetical protein
LDTKHLYKNEKFCTYFKRLARRLVMKHKILDIFHN